MLEMARHVPYGSSNSPTGRNKVYPRAAKASSIFSDKFTKRKSNSAKTVPSQCTAGICLQSTQFQFRIVRHSHACTPSQPFSFSHSPTDYFHNPFLICCSAGVGRTGVFITLSIVLERMQYEGVVDVFQAVRILRTQRPAMVQTEVYMKFIYFFYRIH